MKWTGFAAILTGIAGVLTAWAAVVRARNQGHEQCRDELRAARDESENMARELHAMRMRNESGVASLLLILAVCLFGACVMFTALTINGERGAPGVNGTEGEQGERGPQGIAGRDGRDGLSIVGAPGTEGADGGDGSNGADGVGTPGADGEPGAPGIGVPGVQGAPGVNGVGIQGERGPRGLRGVPGPTCPPDTRESTVTLTVKVLGESVDVGALVCVLD